MQRNGAFSPAASEATAPQSLGRGGGRYIGQYSASSPSVAVFAVFFHPDTLNTLFDAGKLTVTLLSVIANALILKHVLTDEQVPQQIASAMLFAGLGPIMFLIVVNIILLIGGQFMEPS